MILTTTSDNLLYFKFIKVKHKPSDAVAADMKSGRMIERREEAKFGKF